jgi:hypothetical protein
MHFTISSQVLDQFEKSKKWRPVIMVEAQPSFKPAGKYNLVDYLSPSLCTDCSFPHDSNLRFNLFYGLKDEKIITKYLIDRAREGGTILKVSQSYTHTYKNNEKG